MIHYHDGEKVTLSSDRAQLREEVEKWEGPGGGEKLDAFLACVTILYYRVHKMGYEEKLIGQRRSTTRFSILLSGLVQGFPIILIFTTTGILEELL